NPALVKPDGLQTRFLLKNLLQSSNIGASPPASTPWRMANKQQDGGVLEVEKVRLKPPPLFKVLLLNDDYTPMDFVVVVLQTVFAMSREKATQVMLQVHREGMGVCGTYVREVAAAKVDQVIDIARRHQHPLKCTMEQTSALRTKPGVHAAPRGATAAAAKGNRDDCAGTGSLPPHGVCRGQAKAARVHHRRAPAARDARTPVS